MPLLPTPLRALFSTPTAAAAAGPPHLLVHRRSSLAGALLFLSLGAVAGCAFSHRRLTFLRVRSLSSVRMESTSTTVPSIVVYVTVPNREAGKKLAGSIISEKLAACVNIVPGIESVYWWEGKVQSDGEELLIIKTRESLLDALTEHVKANHEYDVPEVIALPIKGGNLKYLEWLKNSTREN
ncbi:protein CutA 1, chloroplastic-like [Phragmites australis]|uniref:protein CutA 1, chloroplastic-like n=1 Tax=Phragmites australis TaxID=29695 RepID=UPI002D798327|nr:protein CutA 1, chloroplastic-like [Phragmites australis]